MNSKVLENVAFDKAVPFSKSANQTGITDMSLVSDVKVELEVKLGQLKLSMGELFDLQPKMVLKMEQSVDEPVEVYLGENRVAIGNLVVVDEHLGVEITDVMK